MPRRNDSDGEPGELVMTQRVDCTVCGDEHEVDFPTGAVDEDGLADLSPGDLVVKVGCGDHTFTAEYTGWMMFGEAG